MLLDKALTPLWWIMDNLLGAEGTIHDPRNYHLFWESWRESVDRHLGGPSHKKD